MAVANHSYESAGLDDPGRQWMQHWVRVKTHPEWGLARAVRWFPAEGGAPERLRIMTEQLRQPLLVDVADVNLVTPEAIEP